MRSLAWSFLVIAVLVATPQTHVQAGDGNRAAGSVTSRTPAQGASPASMTLDAGWRFHKGDAPGAETPAFEDRAWEAVAVPHTWNAADAYSAGFYRGPGWYRRRLEIPAAWKGSASSSASRRSGAPPKSSWTARRVGDHKGAFAAFAFELTRQVRPGADAPARGARGQRLPGGRAADERRLQHLRRHLPEGDRVRARPRLHHATGLRVARRLPRSNWRSSAARADIEVMTKVSNGTDTRQGYRGDDDVADASGKQW